MTGIHGCCAPSLWCLPDGCYTQGYAKLYSNYGWLSRKNDQVTTSYPVYTCYNNSLPNLLKSSNISLQNGLFSAKGHFSLYPNSSVSSPTALVVNIFGAECNNVEIVYCRHCNSNHTCPFGSSCITTKIGSPVSACYANCDSLHDKSCPRGYYCSSFVDLSAGPFNCIPNTTANVNSWCSTHNFANNEDALTCKVNSATLQQQVSMSNSGKQTIILNTSYLLEPGFSLSKQYPYQASSQKCQFNSDCFDGNICTRDSCELSQGYCYNELVNASCDSILQNIRERIAPYIYHLYYLTNTDSHHEAFQLFMTQHGTESTVSFSDDWPYQTENLHFNFTFFGNVINQCYIGPNGLVMLPPLPPTVQWRAESYEEQFSFFSSFSNVIAPWYADWNPGSSRKSKVLIYHQNRSDNSHLFGIDASAIHIFFYNVHRYSTAVDNASHSFAASLYSDGSIRFSFIDGSHNLIYSDLSGLWGAFVSQQMPSFSRYHFENVSTSVILNSRDVVFCYFNSIACVQNTCVKSGTLLKVQWQGTTSCDALASSRGNSTPILLACHWAGGLAITVAHLRAGIVQCEVPFLPLSDGFITFVEIVISVDSSVLPTGVDVEEGAENYSGSKSLFGISFGNYSEIARTSLIIEYHKNVSSSYPSTKCGCNPLFRDSVISTCDKNNICGDDDVHLDCFGTAFGSAYLDNCGICSMGYTGRLPSSTCGKTNVYTLPPPQSNFLSLLSQTIILLLIICCLTFITSAVSYTVRRLLYQRNLDDQMLESELELTMMELDEWPANRNRTGLSDFEREALGEVTFTRELYQTLVAKAGPLKSADSPPPSQKTSTVDVAIDENCESSETTNQASLTSCECSICLMDIQEGNICRMLPEPCGHVFHLACIDEWLRQSLVCPLCKRSIRAILEGVEEERVPPVSANRVGLNSSGTNRNNAYVELTQSQVADSQPELPPPRTIIPSSGSSSRHFHRIRSRNSSTAQSNANQPTEIRPLSDSSASSSSNDSFDSGGQRPSNSLERSGSNRDSPASSSVTGLFQMQLRTGDFEVTPLNQVE